MKTVNIGLVGSRFVSEIHALGLQRVVGGGIQAVAGPTATNLSAFARRFNIPHHFTDYNAGRSMELDRTVIGTPKDVHAPITIDACDKAGVNLLYAGEL